MRRLIVLATIGASSLLLAACGSSSIGGGIPADSPTPTDAVTTSSPSAPPALPADCPAFAGLNAFPGTFGQQPTVPKPNAVPAPTVLKTENCLVGKGAGAKATDTVTVNYDGVLWSSGKVFQSSFTTGTPATFALNQVIPGWQAGIPGMKVGGRRLLVIPASQAYGASPPAGSGIPANAPLIFVVDMISINGQ